VYKEQEDNKHEDGVRASNNSETNEGVVGPQPAKMVVHSRWEKLRVSVMSMKLTPSGFNSRKYYAPSSNTVRLLIINEV